MTVFDLLPGTAVMTISSLIPICLHVDSVVPLYPDNLHLITLESPVICYHQLIQSHSAGNLGDPEVKKFPVRMSPLL